MKPSSKKVVAAAEISEKYPTSFHIAGSDETVLFLARDAFEADQVAMAFLAGFEEGSQCNPRKVPPDELKVLREAIARIRAGLANPRNSGIFLKNKREIVAALRQSAPEKLSAPMIEAARMPPDTTVKQEPSGLTPIELKLPKQHVGKTEVRQILPAIKQPKKVK